MTPRRAAVLSAVPDRDQRKLEREVLVLQSGIAAFFVTGTLLGWFGTHSAASQAGACWIAVHHFVHAWYILTRRIPGRPIPLVEVATPLLDISCITTAWVVLGQAQSPFWAVYLFALVAYGRRYHGMPYLALAGFILVNVLFGRFFILWSNGDSAPINADLLTMIVLTVAMASLSHAIGSAWRQAERRARILAETDPLTAIANRRVFMDRLTSLAEDPGQSFALLMLDLDDFKRLNDEFGHLHGDEVLARVAGVLIENVRDGDEVARYGGEEFVVAMPNTTLSAATQVAERLREAVLDATATSVSIGCAAREPGEQAAAVLRRADDLLLTAKRTGKNAVRSAQVRTAA